MAAELIVERRGAAMIATLSNPGMKNALAPEMYDALLGCAAQVGRDASCRAMILTGAAGSFCAGGNLNRLLENRRHEPGVQAASIDRLHGMVRALRELDKPLIAAVEGPAAGAGCSLALLCDLIVAARDARFVMSYVRVGLSPDGGGSWSSVRALAPQAAAEMLLTGESFTAERLYQLGMVNSVCEPGGALDGALEWVGRIEKLSPNAVTAAKRLMREAGGHSLDQHLDIEKESFVSCLHHEDAGEAIQAFLEKRPARFGGPT